MDFHAIAAAVSAACAVRCAQAPEARVPGGSINACYRWPSRAGPLFVKLSAHGALPMFEAEAAGLAELAAARALRVPRVLGCGRAGDAAFLALEWLDSGPAGPACAARLGEELAQLHRVSAPRFGWTRDNTIGSTRQQNAQADDWAEFFGTRRLRPQLELACTRGYAALLAEAGERLLEGLPALLAGHRPAPALLHGDLWGGNWFAGSSGEPVIFDPAVYYGDRETDLAMTRLFGGFAAQFYAAYQAAAPLPDGHALRQELYNLYHVLNHANLFGGGYARAARGHIDHLLAALRG